MKFHHPYQVHHTYNGYGYGHTQFEMTDKIVLFCDWDAKDEDHDSLLSKVKHDIAVIKKNFSEAGDCILYRTGSGYHGIWTVPVMLSTVMEIYHEMSSHWFSSGLVDDPNDEPDYNFEDFAQPDMLTPIRQKSLQVFRNTGQPKYIVGWLCAGFCSFPFRGKPLYLRTGRKPGRKARDITRITGHFPDEPSWITEHDQLIAA